MMSVSINQITNNKSRTGFGLVTLNHDLEWHNGGYFVLLVYTECVRF